MEELYLISCPTCQVRLQIKALDANADVRFCPKCGTKIHVIRSQTVPAVDPPAAAPPVPVPPRTMSTAPAVSNSPALLAPHLPTVAVPAPAPKPPPPVQDPLSHVASPAAGNDFEGFDVVDDDAVAPAAPPPSPAPMPLAIPPRQEAPAPVEPIPLKVDSLPPSPLMPLTAEGKAVMPKETIAKKEHREPDLVGTPIWTGIYTFPFRLDNFRIVLLLTVSFTLLMWTLGAMVGLHNMLMAIPAGEELMGMNSLIYNASGHLFVCLTVCAVFITLHQTAIFLRIIEETAGGVDQFSWPRDPWYEFMVRWLFLVWTCAVCAAVAYVPLFFLSMAVSIPPTFLAYLVITGAWFVFPIVLLSTMAGGAFWAMLHPLLLFRLAKSPVTLAFLYSNAIFFYLPCSLMGYLVIVGGFWWFAPVVGIVWTVSALIYGRVLGRVALETTEEGKPRRKRKKSRSGKQTMQEDFIELTDADVLGPDTRMKKP